MIRFTTALLMLVIGTTLTTTAIAQDWWAGCNPQAPWCRRLSSDPPQENVRSQWAPGYVAPAHRGSMYMYVPPHRSTHLAK